MTNINREVSKQKPFSYVSLFSGIGGFEQALNKLGGTCVFASEFDKFAQQSYTALYGDEHLYGDITKIDEKGVPEHDLLVGGFPCQAFSVAGKREGFADTRGTLFFDIARIAAVKKPKALLLENVKGLINHDKGNTLDTMIKTLNDIGYVVDFDVLNSKYFGVPQNRERIFIVAIREDLIEAEPFSEESTKGPTVVPKGKRRISGYDDVKTFNFDWPEHEEVTTRLRDILESEVDEKYYYFGRTIDESYKSFTEYGLHVIGYLSIKGHRAIREVYGLDGLSQTLTTMEGGHRQPKVVLDDGSIRKLTPLECFRLQGFPDEAHEAVKQAGISDSQRYKQAGNAVTVTVIEAIAERLIPIVAD